MAKRKTGKASMESGKENANGNKKTLALVKEEPRSFALADKCIKTGDDFANMMSALMSDLIGGRISPNIGNATCNAGGKLLKVVEMQYKYGGKSDEARTLTLAPGQLA